MFDYWKNRRVSTLSRIFDRYPTSFPVLIKHIEGRVYDDVRDLSAGGVCIATSVPMPVASILDLQLNIPECGTVEVAGKVMWANSAAMGVRFESADLRILEAVNRLMKG